MEQEKFSSKGIKRVAITGPESSGKSTLCQALAEHFQTSYAEEFARAYLSSKNNSYELADLDQICSGQLENEKRALSKASELCFFDTDMLVLKIWSEFRFGSVSSLIQNQFMADAYDYYLLCYPDVPWAADPLRESPDLEERLQLFEIYKNYLEVHYPDKYSVIEGKSEARVDLAIRAIERIL